jgi:PPOX class probable F420-dependent enzyme
MANDEIWRFLASPRTAVLSTLGKDGFPHSVGMWFVPFEESRELHMWAYAKSQKIQNLVRDPRCSVMIEEGDGYDALKGVLVQARAHLVDDLSEIEFIGRQLYERYTYPVTGIEVDAGPHLEISRQARKRKGIVIPMQRIASWDHSRLAATESIS